MKKLVDFDYFNYFLELLVISFLMFIFLKIFNYLFSKLLNSSFLVSRVNILSDKKFTTLVSVSKTLSKFLFFVILVIYALSPFVDLTKILAGAGVLGIVLGFGAQSLIKDILTGFFFLFENQFHKGDTVRINNKYTGTVEEVGFRALKIREWGGNVLSISNGNIVEILNGNVEKRRVVESVLFSYNENPDSILRVLTDVCNELNSVLNEHLMRDSSGEIIEDFRIRGLMNLTSHRGGFEYTIVGLVNDENYFDCMYKTREVLVNHIYKNNLKLIEDRVYLVDNKTINN